MNATAEPQLDLQIWARNLDSIATVDPELASRLVETSQTLPPAQLARTRDGGLSFRLGDPNDQQSWFGETSIPRVRAEALLSTFDPGHVNVLLPGIAEGTEVLLLIRRLGVHRAVFVWEENLNNLVLALRLHDYAPAIHQERLVLLATPLEGLTDTLIDWLDRHPGHYCPNRLMMWPWQKHQEIAALRTAVEAAYQQSEARRSQQLANLRPRLAAAVRTGEADAATIVCGMHVRDEVHALADALVDASPTPARSLVLRGPEDVHPLARVQRLHEAGPTDMAILLDITRREINDVLPGELPAVSWISIAGGIDGQIAKRLGHDRLAVTSTWLRNRAIAKGVAPGAVAVCPPPALDFPAETDHPARDIDVLIVADAAPLEPEAYGFTLPTVAQLWTTTVDLMNARIESLHDGEIVELLTRSELMTGFRLSDDAVRSAMLDALTLHVAPMLLTRFYAAALVKEGLVVQLLGTGWPTGGSLGATPLPATLAERREWLSRSQAMLYTDVTGGVSLTALLAPPAGALLLSRVHPHQAAPGGLASLLEPETEYLSFRTGRELVERVRMLRSQERRVTEMRSAARARCLSEHTVARRLQTLRSMVTS